MYIDIDFCLIFWTLPGIAQICKMFYKTIQGLLLVQIQRWAKTVKNPCFTLRTAAHLSYSPNLAPSDYYLFPHLKKWTGRQRFLNNDEVIAAVDGYFKDLHVSSYAASINKLSETDQMFFPKWRLR